MNYNQATLYAQQGYTILLPNWKGYFNWDYNTQGLVFRNEDYYLNEDQIKEKRLHERNDWYYII